MRSYSWLIKVVLPFVIIAGAVGAAWWLRDALNSLVPGLYELGFWDLAIPFLICRRCFSVGLCVC